MAQPPVLRFPLAVLTTAAEVVVPEFPPPTSRRPVEEAVARASLTTTANGLPTVALLAVVTETLAVYRRIPLLTPSPFSVVCSEVRAVAPTPTDTAVTEVTVFVVRAVAEVADPMGLERKAEQAVKAETDTS